MSGTTIEYGSWLAVLILGPGAVAIFVWFLFDLRRLLVEMGRDDPGTR